METESTSQVPGRNRIVKELAQTCPLRAIMCARCKWTARSPEYYIMMHEGQTSPSHLSAVLPVEDQARSNEVVSLALFC